MSVKESSRIENRRYLKAKDRNGPQPLMPSTLTVHVSAEVLGARLARLAAMREQKEAA